MFRALSRAVSQLFDPAIFGVLLMSVAGAALVLAAIWFGVGASLGHAVLFANRWLNWLAEFAVGVGTVFVTIALFGAIAAVIASLFVERVARAVERRYYPGLPAPRSPGIAEQLGGALSFLVTTIAVNLLALPLYLIWGANIPIFLGINGYLLGREYFELVAARRLDRRAVTFLWRMHRPRLILCGALIAALSFVPLANLLTPVLATAFMLHILQDFRDFQEACERTRFGDTPGSLNHRS